MVSLNWHSWRLVVKLDPDKEIDDNNLKIILFSGIDAVLVGGTQNITNANSDRLIRQIIRSGYKGPLVQEISEISAINPMVDGYIIPVVLNASDKQWITGAHFKAIKELGPLINWEQIIPFGYIVCNPDSAVAGLTGTCDINVDDAIAYATLAENIFNLPVTYIEYSGKYGDRRIVEAVANELTRSRLFYGGGIESVPQAIEMLSLADTIVIGNILYKNSNIIKEIRKAYPIG